MNEKGDKYSGEMMIIFKEQTGKNKLTSHGKGHVIWTDGEFILEILGMVIEIAMAYIFPKMGIITMENFLWGGSRRLA